MIQPIETPSLSTVQAARTVGVSPRTLRRWLAEHPVDAQKVFTEHGIEHRFTADALDALLRAVGRPPLSALAQGEAPTLSGRDAQGGEGVGGAGRELAVRAFAPQDLAELRAVLVEAFTEALQRAQAALPAPPPTSAQVPPVPPPSRVAQVLRGAFLGVVGVGIAAAVYLTFALAVHVGAVRVPW